jgi:hypothetical protein
MATHRFSLKFKVPAVMHSPQRQNQGTHTPTCARCFRRDSELAASGQGLPARLLPTNFACGEDRYIALGDVANVLALICLQKIACQVSDVATIFAMQ